MAQVFAKSLSKMLITTVASSLAEKGVEKMFDKLGPVKTSDSSRPRKGVEKMVNQLVTTTICCLAEKGVEMVFDEFESRKKRKTEKALECKTDEAFEELKKKMKALQESFTNLRASRQYELDVLGTELEKMQGNKEEEIAWALESRLKKKFQQLSQSIKTLEEVVQQWPETTKYEFQLVRTHLENKGISEEEIAWALESRLKDNFCHLSQRIQTLGEDVQDLSETTKYELQLLRPHLENQGNKEEEIAWALESRWKKNQRQPSQRIQTLEEDVQEWPRTTKYELQVLIAKLEKNQEIKDEEIAWALESRLKKNFRQLSQRIQTLGEDLQDLSETRKYELKRLRPCLEENQGINEEEIAWALQSWLKKNQRQLSQRIRTLEEDVDDWWERTKYMLKRLRPYLEKNQGISEEEVAWALESRLKKKLRQLSQRTKTLEEDVEDWSDTTKHVLQLLRAHLENQGKEEEESSNFSTETLFLQLSHRIQTLDLELQERQEFSNHMLEFVTADLENHQGAWGHN